jgi:ribosome biogenesis protein Nip4
MKGKVIVDFALQFGVKLVFNDDLLFQCEGRFFLLNSNVKSLVRDNFFYAGIYLGKVRSGKFFPSFNLLSMLIEHECNRIVIDRKASWLFICGRNIFRNSILQAYGKIRQKNHVLVLNELGECLGFGRVLAGFEEQQDNKNSVAIANVLDIGDFLRREREHKNRLDIKQR